MVPGMEPGVPGCEDNALICQSSPSLQFLLAGIRCSWDPLAPRALPTGCQALPTDTQTIPTGSQALPIGSQAPPIAF